MTAEKAAGQLSQSCVTIQRPARWEPLIQQNKGLLFSRPRPMTDQPLHREAKNNMVPTSARCVDPGLLKFLKHSFAGQLPVALQSPLQNAPRLGKRRVCELQLPDPCGGACDNTRSQQR